MIVTILMKALIQSLKFKADIFSGSIFVLLILMMNAWCINENVIILFMTDVISNIMRWLEYVKLENNKKGNVMDRYVFMSVFLKYISLESKMHVIEKYLKYKVNWYDVVKINIARNME